MTTQTTHAHEVLESSRIDRMAFSVKSERASELLAEVRALTGEGITDAVTRSLELRLFDLKTRPRPTAEEIMRSVDELLEKYPWMRWQPGEPEMSIAHGDLLYNQDGLPK